MVGLVLLLALAIGITISFYYAARAAFIADSRERKRIDELFVEIVNMLKSEKNPGEH